MTKIQHYKLNKWNPLTYLWLLASSIMVIPSTVYKHIKGYLPYFKERTVTSPSRGYVITGIVVKCESPKKPKKKVKRQLRERKQ
jgi:hypothetical protein